MDSDFRVSGENTLDRLNSYGRSEDNYHMKVI